MFSLALIVSKWWPFSFSSIGKREKVEWVGDDSHFVLGQKFPGEK
jgi:hypothetical protein